MHAIHKILAEAAGKRKVSPGEIIIAKVDTAGINDIYPQVVHSFNAMGASKVFDPEKIVFIFDHHAPPSTVSAADNQQLMRKFCANYGIKHLTDVNQGICHQVLIEMGLSQPGKLIVITDSHSTSHGALGAFSTGLGATDMAGVLVSGELWLRVPEVVKVDLSGTLSADVMAKDVALMLLGDLGTSFALYKTLEFSGETIQKMPTVERLVLCNMAVEMGAKSAYIAPDNQTRNYLNEKAGIESSAQQFQNDSDFTYQAVYKYNVSGLVPQIACPHSVDNVMPVEQKKGIKINQAFLGSCIGGRVEDIGIASEILEGKKIATGVRLLITPASQLELQIAIEKGYISKLIEAGATLTAVGCGACCGVHQGLIGYGEVCVTASARNFPGRMGSDGSDVYVASPRTVALAALTGHL
ncbi:MAG: aconitase/3-isopropylmalate dehydratase large subunit family protein [Bacillota bacterium]|nr:aconitase/3-isopropylmalate dehydratase large subunit family protein [Bacillota bacterium]MDW7670166.1 aconitase/3-isopropylmalate dehydratase large subunit family protein [Bacillota bacterium]